MSEYGLHIPLFELTRERVHSLPVYIKCLRERGFTCFQSFAQDPATLDFPNQYFAKQWSDLEVPIYLHSYFRTRLLTTSWWHQSVQARFLMSLMQAAQTTCGSAITHVSGGLVEMQENSDSLIRVLSFIGKERGLGRLLLENSAGGGKKVCSDIAWLYQIICQVDPANEWLGLCLDTAHLYAAGYSLPFLDSPIMSRVDLIHANNVTSKVRFGFHLDRHAGVDGLMGEELYSFLRSVSCPLVFEMSEDDAVKMLEKLNES